MPNEPREREDREGELATQKKRRIEKIRRYKVVLHNDNYTTMEFVVLVLMKFDRNRGKRTNWLLIKHRDAYEKVAKGVE